MIKRSGTILALFTGLNLLNYLDRLVVSAVLPRVMTELRLSNLEGGLLATVFLLGYFFTAPIFGSLGDRIPRKGLIAAGVVIWSLATIASGFATGLWSLLAARVFVGVGEASYATLAPTIIDDVTPTERKGRALAIFYIATPIGGALGYLVGGFVEARWGWRSAFFVAGGPGIVLALLCLVIDEPARKVATDKANIARDIRKLARMDLYRKGVLGYCAQTAAIGAFSYWAPQFLVKRYAMELAPANFKFGIITVVGGAIGTIIGGRWADRAGGKSVSKADPAVSASPADGSAYRDETPERRGEREAAAMSSSERTRIRALLRVCAIGSAVGVPLTLAAFLSPSSNIFFLFVFLAIVFLFLVTSPINAVVLQAVPSSLRASAMALSIFSIHALGDLWSPPLVGFLADHMPVQIAMMSLPLAIAVSAAVWLPRKA